MTKVLCERNATSHTYYYIIYQHFGMWGFEPQLSTMRASYRK